MRWLIEACIVKIHKKLMLCTNNLPTIDSADDAIRRRVTLVTFNQPFVINPVTHDERRLSEALSKKIDNDSDWRQAFVRILFSYSSTDVTEPDSVLIATESYRSDNSDIGEWLKANVHHSDGGYVTLDDIITMHTGQDGRTSKTKG